MTSHGLDTWMATRRLRSPDKAALVCSDGSTITYGELARMAESVSTFLWRSGIRQGDRVAYVGENSPEYLYALFGSVQLGAVFVPVNTRLADPEIAHVLSDSGARVIIHNPEFSERLASLGTSEVLVVTTGAGNPGTPGLRALSMFTTPEYEPANATLDDPAAIIYTSGTTGRAKGATLTHGNLSWVALNALVDYDIASTEVALMISPLFHVASLGMGALPVILKGGTLVLEQRFEAGRALALIEKHRVTMLSGVPTTFQLLADHPAWDSTDLSSLTKLTCGGSPVPTRILSAFEDRGLSFSQGYGMTETSPGATSLAPAMARAKKGSVGLPHFFTEVRIVDEHGARVPHGTVGEIEILGPNVFPGYHNQPEATAAAFSPDGWFQSGDLGYLDADGYLYIADRLKDMIISGGENIYPAEIENLLYDIEGVTGAAVIGMPDERWGEVPWAILTLANGAEVDSNLVRGFLDGKIARYKIPVRIEIVKELPRTASGKVRKIDLRQRFGQT